MLNKLEVVSLAGTLLGPGLTELLWYSVGTNDRNDHAEDIGVSGENMEKTAPSERWTRVADRQSYALPVARPRLNVMADMKELSYPPSDIR